MMLHLLVPGALAWFAFSTRWQRAWLIMLLTMAVDVDHLLATPVYDPQRCGIGFHPFHTWVAIAVYCGMLFCSKTRVVGAGLVVHMALDALDCVWIALE
jgi:hypothetical protein